MIIGNVSRLICPGKIHSDFGKAHSNALKGDSPRSAARGDGFSHLVQKMRKHVEQLESAARCDNEREFAPTVGMTTALSLVSTAEIEFALRALAEYSP